jgi:predicted TIM-barrel fold metal-dependent hydrolase
MENPIPVNGVFSGDDHILEHPNVWKDRMSKQRWGERIPHVEDSGGSQYWVIDRARIPLSNLPAPGDLLSDRASKANRWDEIPRYAYDPKERIKAMRTDGIEYSVLYPTISGLAGERLAIAEDPEFARACIAAYNDWIIEEWADCSPHFLPQCVVPFYSVSCAVAEVRRAVAKGHKGVVLPDRPSLLSEVQDDLSSLDPFWSVCEELDVPICFHAGCSMETQFPPHSSFSELLKETFQAITRSLSSSFTLATVIFSRVFQRHPKLKVIFADCPIGWGQFILETLNYLSSLDGLESDLRLYETVKRHCYFMTSFERLDLASLRIIGPENLLWCSHFPFSTSTWPNSDSYMRSSRMGMSEADRLKVLRQNGLKLYNVLPVVESRRKSESRYIKTLVNKMDQRLTGA